MPNEAAATDTTGNFFALLEAWEFSRATACAKRMAHRTKRLSQALQHLASCESMYLSARCFESSARAASAGGLERRLDATAFELEACLLLPAQPPPTQLAMRYATPDLADCSLSKLLADCSLSKLLLERLLTCQAAGPCPPQPDASPDTSTFELSAADVAAVREAAWLLRLRKAALPIYRALLSTATSPERFAELSEHTALLQAQHASCTPASPMLRGVRAASRTELAALAHLLLALAVLPACRAREALVALAVAQLELRRLSSTERDAAREVAATHGGYIVCVCVWRLHHSSSVSGARGGRNPQPRWLQP